MGFLVENRKEVKRSIKNLRKIKTWQLVLLLFVGSFASATFLRINNVEMSKRREAVLKSDKAKDLEGIKSGLYDLSSFVASHMNTSTGTFFLEQTYREDVKQAYEKASKAEGEHGNIFVKAQEVCAPKFSSWSLAYVQCVDQELGKFPAAHSYEESLELPKADLYRHEFNAPLLSFDPAGISIIFLAFIVLIILARAISLIILKILLKRYKTRV